MSILSEMFVASGSHLHSVFGSDAWKRSIFKNASIQKLHYIKCCPNYRRIFAEAISIWDRNIGLPKRMDDLVLSLDSVCCLGEQPSWRLLSQYVFTIVGCSQLICWI